MPRVIIMVQLGEERSYCRCQLPSQSTFGSRIPALLNLLRTCNRNPHTCTLTYTRSTVTYAHKHTEYSYFTLFLNLVCFPFYKMHKKSDTQLWLCYTCFVLASCGYRHVNDGGWETICSAEERAGGKGEQVCGFVAFERKMGCCGALRGGALEYKSCRVGTLHPHTHTRLRLKKQAVRQAPLRRRTPTGLHTWWGKRPPHHTHG